MSIITDFVQNLPLYLLSLPIILLALSVHETAHGFIACKLGDSTAKNLGRLTLNPVKHIDIFGFISMLLFHIGWAKPVPVNSRYFKKPKRDMAITGAAGPVSNFLLAIVFLVILRVSLIFISNSFLDEAMAVAIGTATASTAYTAMSLLVYILNLGVTLNISLAIFNLLPFPPFDGSRIFYVFLPERLYFKVMQYERYIMIVLMVLLFIGVFDTPLNYAFSFITNGLFSLVGMGDSELLTYSLMHSHVYSVLGSFAIG
ncbi:MAG: site-2 protease family protein [Ruminococcaceae bacterium]|nr:site-2 protease family protein [Oscillospiraceae bacterium]